MYIHRTPIAQHRTHACMLSYMNKILSQVLKGKKNALVYRTALERRVWPALDKKDAEENAEINGENKFNDGLYIHVAPIRPLHIMCS
jgi:hypothetical protein